MSAVRGSLARLVPAKCLINGVTNIVTMRDRAPAMQQAPCCVASCEVGAVRLCGSAEQLGDPPEVTQLVTEPTGAQATWTPRPPGTSIPPTYKSELCPPIFHSGSPSMLHPAPTSSPAAWAEGTVTCNGEGPVVRAGGPHCGAHKRGEDSLLTVPLAGTASPPCTAASCCWWAEARNSH